MREPARPARAKPVVTLRSGGGASGPRASRPRRAARRWTATRAWSSSPFPAVPVPLRVELLPTRADVDREQGDADRHRTRLGLRRHRRRDHVLPLNFPDESHGRMRIEPDDRVDLATHPVQRRRRAVASVGLPRSKSTRMTADEFRELFGAVSNTGGGGDGGRPGALAYLTPARAATRKPTGRAPEWPSHSAGPCDRGADRCPPARGPPHDDVD